MSCERRAKGFSLVEIMVVIVIIGLLAGAVTLGTRAYLAKAKTNVARKDIATIVSALESWYAEYSKYPTTSEGLAVLTAPSEKWPEPLLGAEPKDPWGHPYEYKCPGPGDEPYEIICHGADGRQGGSGVDADISSADVKK